MTAPDMVATTIVEVAGRSVTVRELTMAELRAHMTRLAADARESRDAMEVLLIEGWDLDEMSVFCDVSTADLDAMRPSEIRTILTAIERMNADFFACRARLKGLAEALQKPEKSLSAPLPT